MRNSKDKKSKLSQRTNNILKYSGMILSFVVCSLIWSCFAYDRVPYRSGTAIGFVVLVLCGWSAYTDFCRRKIYNLTTYSAFVVIVIEIVLANAFDFHAKHIGAVDFASSTIGAAICFCIPFAPYLAGQGGAGDVKLAAIVGCALGTGEGILTICFAYIVAFIWALSDMAIRKTVFSFRRSSVEQSDATITKRSIPMAPSFLIAVAATTTGAGLRLLSLPLIEF